MSNNNSNNNNDNSNNNCNNYTIIFNNSNNNNNYDSSNNNYDSSNNNSYNYNTESKSNNDNNIGITISSSTIKHGHSRQTMLSIDAAQKGLDLEASALRKITEKSNEKMRSFFRWVSTVTY